MSKLSLFAGVLLLGLSSAISQQPLRPESSTIDNAVALDELKAVVGDDLISASPIAAPCYEGSGDCDAIRKLTKKDTWLSDQPGGYFSGNWASCQAAGELCTMPLNGEPISPDAKCFQGSVPEMVIKVHNISYIQAGFKYARDTKTPLVIKNTGHDGVGRSAGPGALALWTHHLKHPQVPIVLNRTFVPDGCVDYSSETVVHTGAGETWENAYVFAHKHNLSLVGGSCGTVGVAGGMLGGGHSPLSTKYGLEIDHLMQIEIVTPDGQIKVANECQNPDLFFAARGGGGGTFGVITNITYRALPVFEMQEFTFDFHDNASLTAIEAHRFFDITTANAVDWSDKGWGGYIRPKTKSAKGNIQLIRPGPNLAAAKEDMHELSKLLEGKGTFTWATRASWYEYFVANLQPWNDNAGGHSTAVASRLVSEDYFQGRTRKELIHELVKLQEADLNLALMLVTPRSFNSTKMSALHPSWANAVWEIRINDGWDQFYDNPTAEAGRAHFQKVHDAMQSFRRFTPDMGTSISEADIWEDEHIDTYWGRDNYRRLLDIKKRVDPDNILSTYGAVNFDPDDPRYRCYPKK